MTTTLPKTVEPTPAPPSGNGHGEEAAAIDRIRKKARARRLRAAQALTSRIIVAHDGTRSFLRFTRAQRLEHQILLFSFTALAITGLLQRYSGALIVGLAVNNLFGGVETVRIIHHVAAVIFGALAIYHTINILLMWFLKRERGAMWPRLKDFSDLIRMMKYNLGLAHARPAFDRFSVEEKLEYWALLWGTAVMGLTGVLQWFPLLTTSILPGEIIPIARLVHSLEAMLAVLSILIWHLYHTVIKERNRSIYTGVMSEREMQELHPLEYRRILAAQEYLQKSAADEKLGMTKPALGDARHEVASLESAN